MPETIPGHFSALQLREKGYDNPVEGKKAHGRREPKSKRKIWSNHLKPCISGNESAVA